MYIRRATIENIKGIEYFEMNFTPFSRAGWHVLIGDNGSGKTTVLRGMGMVLLGSDALSSLDLNPNDLLRIGAKVGFATLELEYELEFDKVRIEDIAGQEDLKKGVPKSFWPPDFRVPEILPGKISIQKYQGKLVLSSTMYSAGEARIEYVFASAVFDGKSSGFFSCGYGPVRRLANNGSMESKPRSEYFATLFGDHQQLSSAWEWIRKLGIDADTANDARQTLAFVIDLVNASELIPDGAKLTDQIDSKGIKYQDPEGNLIYLEDGSDGYRSVISLLLDILRNMVAQYGIEVVMGHHVDGVIRLPGVVLIDEVDAHLHPDWQVRLGDRFTRSFPLVQFIVTTHSPLVCRGCGDTGWIWHLRKPGSEEKSGPVTEIQRKRLVYGDILDAYDTGVFGPNQSSENSVALRERMASLHLRSIKGLISDEERRELQDLQSFL